MKRLSNLLAALVFASLVIFMSCGGGGDNPKPNPLATAANDLTSSSWKMTSVSTNGGVADGNWNGFTLTFNGNKDGGSYSTSNAADGFSDVWPNRGDWEFGDANGALISRSDGVDMTATISSDELTLEFRINTGGGRTSGIDGNWVFVFEP